MRESLMYGSVRGARANSRPYRDILFLLHCMSPVMADFVAKVFFALVIKISFGCTRDFRVNMWGTSLPEWPVMTDTKREDELKRMPAQSGRSDLPPGKLRSISMDEIDLLQIDRNGRLYWDGKPVEVSRRLTFWQSVGAFIVGTFVVIGSVGSFLQGWTVYHDLACRMGWYTFAVTCVPM